MLPRFNAETNLYQAFFYDRAQDRVCPLVERETLRILSDDYTGGDLRQSEPVRALYEKAHPPPFELSVDEMRYALFAEGLVPLKTSALHQTRMKRVFIVCDNNSACVTVTEERGKQLLGAIAVVGSRSSGTKEPIGQAWLAERASLLLKWRRAVAPLLPSGKRPRDEQPVQKEEEKKKDTPPPTTTTTTTVGEEKKPTKRVKKTPSTTPSIEAATSLLKEKEAERTEERSELAEAYRVNVAKINKMIDDWVQRYESGLEKPIDR